MAGPLIANAYFNSDPAGGKPFNGKNGIELLDPTVPAQAQAIPSWTVTGQRVVAWMAATNERGIASPGATPNFAFVDLTGGAQAGSVANDGSWIYGSVESNRFRTTRGRRYRVTILLGTFESDEPGQLPRAGAGPCSVRIFVEGRGDDPTARVVHPTGGEGTQWIQGSVDFRASGSSSTVVLRGELTPEMVRERGAGSDFIGVSGVTVEELRVTLWESVANLVAQLIGDVRRIVFGRR
jgi:hypothetical protein